VKVFWLMELRQPNLLQHIFIHKERRGYCTCHIFIIFDKL